MTVTSYLSALESAGLIYLAPTVPEPEYLFRHALIQEAAYATLLKTDRRILHRSVGEVLEQLHLGRPEDLYGTLAYHFRQAEVNDKAQVYLLKAAEQARIRYANEDALRFCSEALAITTEQDAATRYTIILTREKVYDVLGDREAQAQDLARLAGLAERLNDAVRGAEVALRQANYAEVVSDYPATIANAQRAVALAQHNRSTEDEAHGRLIWGRALWRQGDYSAAHIQLEQALTLARSVPLAETWLTRIEADALRNLGAVAYYQGDSIEARKYFDQSLQLCRALGYRRGESNALNNLGVVARTQGNLAEARAYYQVTLDLDREMGDRWGEAATLGNLGTAAAEQGDYASARAYQEQSLRLCRDLNDPRGASNALFNLGSVSRQQGDYATAQAHYEQSLTIRREIGDRQGECETLAYLGLLLHHLDDDSTAQRYAREALRIAHELESKSLKALALTHLGHAQVDFSGEAAVVYQQALALWRELKQPTRALEALAGLCRVSLAQNDLPHARMQAEEILEHLKTGFLTGADEPFWIYLTCYHALRAHADPRAAYVLETARSLLKERAAMTDDKAMRRSFLENVSSHRELLALIATVGG
jgi:tetratricopeptide (TPR) repeat protein